jgi:argonaute family protein
VSLSATVIHQKEFTFENSVESVNKVVEAVLYSFNGNLGFALIFGRSKEFSEEEDETFDYYVPLKRQLFNNEILSQNFVLEEYLNENGEIDKKRIEYALSNIIYNIFGKLGIKFFVLEEKVPYDYILGIDVGFGEAYTGRVAGCTTVHDSEGRLKNIIPVSKQNLPEKESARIKPLLEYIESKRRIYKINFKNKNILILRDGKIQREEVEQLKEFSRSRNCKIVLIDVKKNTLYQLLRRDKIAYYVKLGDFYLLKAHSPRVGFPRLIKISQKVVVEGDNVTFEKPTEDDIFLIYRLTALNYSTIGKPSNLRIPSPVYYADKLVKALKKGWDFKEDYLKDGILYFL